MISIFGQPSRFDGQGEIGVLCVSARIRPAQTPQTLELLVYTVASSEVRTSPVTTGSVSYFFAVTSRSVRSGKCVTKLKFRASDIE
jgi:hypothetical protein